MGIKPDTWIRRTLDEMGMIEPFEPGQCREVNGEKSFPMAPQAMAMMFAAPMSLRSSPMSARRPLTPIILIKTALSTSKATAALFRRIHLPWRGRSNSFVFHVPC